MGTIPYGNIMLHTGINSALSFIATSQAAIAVICHLIMIYSVIVFVNKHVASFSSTRAAA
jgi:hypothetical protein